MTRLLIIGSGSHGRIVAEAATQSGMFRVIGFPTMILAEPDSSLTAARSWDHGPVSRRMLMWLPSVATKSAARFSNS